MTMMDSTGTQRGTPAVPEVSHCWTPGRDSSAAYITDAARYLRMRFAVR